MDSLNGFNVEYKIYDTMRVATMEYSMRMKCISWIYIKDMKKMLYDVITVGRGTRKIYITRVGVGEKREATY